MYRLSEIFSGKRVLITGHTGFKGSWLSVLLKQVGADVSGLALEPEQDSLFSQAGLAGMMNHYVGDIRDKSVVERAFKEVRPEYVFHLAAQALVLESYEDPKTTFDTNIAGSVNILEVVRNLSSVRSLVYITSDKCYRNKEWVWGYRENDELGGHDPYSASKAAAELVFSAYQASFFADRENLGAASVRAGNVIGGGDWSAGRVIPDCIRAARSASPVELRNPDAIRPWQHVLEPLSGYCRLAARLYRQPEQYSGSWNFGPDFSETQTVHELASQVIDLLGHGEIIVSKDGDRQHEATLLQLNCDKAYRLLGWRSRWDFATTVNKTVDWYQRVEAGEDALGITYAHIADYFGEEL